MMSWIKKFIEKHGLLPRSYADEQIDASIESSYREHAEAVQLVNAASAARHASNERLRRSINEAKEKNAEVFAEFEWTAQHRLSGEDRFPHV